jgi:hypothetical protein
VNGTAGRTDSVSPDADRYLPCVRIGTGEARDRLAAASTWQTEASIRESAAAVRDWPGQVVFLSTGGRDLAAFAGDEARQGSLWFAGPLRP